MNEKKKLYIMLGVIIGIIVVVLGAYIIGNIATQKLLKEIDEKMNLEEVQVFYLTRPTCHYCTLLEPVTDTLKQEYPIEYNQINVDNYNKSQLKKILKKFNVNPDDFGTPYIAITKNGVKIQELNGYADENIVFELFQKTGIIPEDANLLFQYINYETFKNKWNSEEKSIIMIGEPGEVSMQARNTLKPFIQKHNLIISYMDITETGDNQTYSEFLKTIGYTNPPTYPILMVVQNGSIIDKVDQLTNEVYEIFLKNNGYIG